jgi:hypothetical protein
MYGHAGYIPEYNVQGQRPQLPYYSPPSSTSSGPRYIVPIILSYVIAVLSGCYGYYTLRVEITALKSQLSSLDSVYSAYRAQNENQITGMQNQLVDQSMAIKHLSNVSNAHVLQELDSTRTDVYSKLLDARAGVLVDLAAAQVNITNKLTANKMEIDGIIEKSVYAVRMAQQNVTSRLEHNAEELRVMQDQTNTALRVAQHNVTTTLAKNKQELGKALADTDAAMAAAESNITAKLAKSSVEFKAIVSSAKDQIAVVQQNLTQNLVAMKAQLSATASDLNEQVKSAKATIDEEVQAVQDSIEDYVAFTNKKLASENDFVRFQLAGLVLITGY